MVTLTGESHNRCAGSTRKMITTAPLHLYRSYYIYIYVFIIGQNLYSVNSFLVSPYTMYMAKPKKYTGVYASIHILYIWAEVSNI